LKLRVLIALFVLAVLWSAVAPLDPADYLLEIVTPLGGLALLLATRRRLRFTDLSYVLLFLEGLVLVVGAHYTHERVPLFDWLRPVFSWQRNNYDRFAHLCVGVLLVIPVREILRARTPLRGPWLNVLSGIGILAFAAFYEITEWWIAIGASPGAAEAYLGSQGDPWDAQKDMLCDGLGAVLGLAVLWRRNERELAARQ
jgi:putative membrane protein